MNRAERRRLERQKSKQSATYNLNNEQIKQLKSDASNKAIDTAFKLMVSIPVMIMHDKYAQLMKREVDGVGREERFANMILDLYDSYMQGYVTLDDLEKCLEEETGMRFEDVR